MSSVPVTNERQLRRQEKPKFSRNDRVGTLSTNWYDKMHRIAELFSVVHGTVINATVLWDLDQTSASISLDKLTLLPPDAPFQFMPDLEENDYTIFKKKSKPRRGCSKGKNAKPVLSTEPAEICLSSASDGDEAPSSSKQIIKITTKKMPKKKVIKGEKSSAKENVDAELPNSSCMKTRAAEKSKRPPRKRSAVRTEGEQVTSKKPAVKSLRSVLSKRSTEDDKLSNSSSDSSESSESDDSNVLSDTVADEDIAATAASAITGITKKAAPKRKKTPEERRADRIKEEKDFGWVDGDRAFDVRGPAVCGYGPRLKNFDLTRTKAMDFFVHFFPFKHLRDVILPLTNREGSKLFSFQPLVRYHCWRVLCLDRSKIYPTLH